MAALTFEISYGTSQKKSFRTADDYFRVEYGDIVMLKGRPYLIRQSAKEGRFGLDDEVKHWVKYSIDLENDSRCIIKLVFHEKFSYDLFGLGNILIYLAGKGDILIQDLKRQDHPALAEIDRADLNIVFHNRVANLKKVYPYIPEALNRVLLHFSNGAKRFYEHTDQLLEDLAGCAEF